MATNCLPTPSARKRKSPYRAGATTPHLSDKRMIPRIKEYLSEISFQGRRTISPQELALALQERYLDYARKKKRPFTLQVQHAYSWLCSKDEGEVHLQELEDKHLSKVYQSKERKVDSDPSSSLSFDSEADFEIDFENSPQLSQAKEANMMNKMLHSIYQPMSTPTLGTPCPATPTLGTPSPATPTLGTPTRGCNSLTDVGDSPQAGSSLTEVRSSKCSSSSKKTSQQSVNRDGRDSKKRRLSKQFAKASEPEGSTGPADPDFVPITSNVKLLDVGGNEHILEEVCRLLLHVCHPEMYRRLGVTPPGGVLIHGPPGSGKTLLAHAIAGELGFPFYRLAATEVVTGISGESEEKLRRLFNLAKSAAPCVLFLDEIDAISPKRDTVQREMEKRIVAQLLACLDDLVLHTDNPQVVVIGATNRPEALDPALRRSGRFDHEVALGMPNQVARESILTVLCKGLKLSDNVSLEELAELTPGFVGADLKALIASAARSAVNRTFESLSVNPSKTDLQSENPLPSTLKDRTCREELNTIQTLTTWLHNAPPISDDFQNIFITFLDFKIALKKVVPSAKREGFVTVPDTTWSDIGALDHIREELKMAILAPVHYAKQFETLGLVNPPGILLAGPPGCGKTLLAKAIANESGINFISVKGPELLNMYLGESERAVRQVFQRARNSAPCVIFFDELDSLCPRRTQSSENAASSRVVNQLLTEMDGLEGRRCVFVMAATNRPDIIDPAMLRPGRLDKVLYVGLPSAAGREAILRTLTQNGTKPPISTDVSLAAVARDQRCNGFTGADLSALVREAALAALKFHMPSSPVDGSVAVLNRKEEFDVTGCMVTDECFSTAFARVKKSVSERDISMYEQMALKYKNGQIP